MFGGIGIQEVMIILVVGLLVFGASRLPKIAKSLGQGIKEFKKTIKDTTDDEESEGSRVRYMPNQPQVSQQYYPGIQPGVGQANNPYAQYPQYQGQNPQYTGQNPPYQGPVPPYQQNMGGPGQWGGQQNQGGQTGGSSGQTGGEEPRPDDKST